MRLINDKEKNEKFYFMQPRCALVNFQCAFAVTKSSGGVRGALESRYNAALSRAQRKRLTEQRLSPTRPEKPVRPVLLDRPLLPLSRVPSFSPSFFLSLPPPPSLGVSFFNLSSIHVKRTRTTRHVNESKRLRSRETPRRDTRDEKYIYGCPLESSREYRENRYFQNPQLAVDHTECCIARGELLRCALCHEAKQM